MSHFAVLVITPTDPTENNNNALGEALAPFHEFECTGRDDRYVIDVDRTEEIRLDYQTDERSLVESQIGALSNFAKFAREDTGYGIVREDWTQIDEDGMPIDEDKNYTKFGRVVVDANGQVLNIIQRTNPNAKWDSYQLGGRWGGMLRSKLDGFGYRANSDRLYAKDVELNKFDALRRCDLNLEAMLEDARGDRRAKWNEIIERVKQANLFTSEEELDAKRLLVDAENKREFALFTTYRDNSNRLEFLHSNRLEFLKKNYNPDLFEYRKAMGRNFDIKPLVSLTEPKIADWIEAAPAFGTYAVLKDGEWLARGEMGWFGMSNDALSEEEWQTKFDELVRNTPEDHWLSIVDCHT